MANPIDKAKRIGVLMGGFSAERNVSLETGETVANALCQMGYKPICLDVDRQIAGHLSLKPIDVAFLALHGSFGEDGCIQGLLEVLGIPYTGSGVLASALAMDKVQSKRFLVAHGFPTAMWAYPANLQNVEALGFPMVVKPRRGGSSIGVSVVDEPKTLITAISHAGGEDEAFAERYLSGQEIAAAVLGSGNAARCLGTVEVRPVESFYNYEAKYNREDTKYYIPASVPERIQRTIMDHALRLHRLFDCRGATRTDFIWDGEHQPVILELNTIPGMTSHSLLPKIAAHQGINYQALVEAILNDARCEQG